MMPANPALLPPWRITLLRLCYGFVALGLAAAVGPELLFPPTKLAFHHAAVLGFLFAMMLGCFIGIFRPLAMLPVLLFEMTWKGYVMARLVLPAWLAGTLSADLQDLFIQCLPIIVFIPVIPWAFAWRRLNPLARADRKTA